MAYGSTREVVMSYRSLLAMGDGPQNGTALVGDEPLWDPPQSPGLGPDPT